MKAVAILLISCVIANFGSTSGSVPVGERLLGGGTFTYTGLGFLRTNTLTTLSTTFFTTTTTATSAIISSCIPSNQFLSATACRRRRAIFEDSGLDILPSARIEIQPSVIVEEENILVPEIISSGGSVEDAVAPVMLREKNGRAVYSYVTSTIFSTITSFSFSSTTFTSTLNVGSTTSVLTCLPAGIILCT